MGKRSIKENKNIYQIYREQAELTREKASERMEFISADRIEKIESEKSLPHPDEILVMADCYKTPDLCNYFCSHECPIGMKYVPEIKYKDLSQIVLQILVFLHELQNVLATDVAVFADQLVALHVLAEFCHAGG